MFPEYLPSLANYETAKVGTNSGKRRRRDEVPRLRIRGGYGKLKEGRKCKILGREELGRMGGGIIRMEDE